MHNNLLFHARRLCSTGTFYVLDDSPDSHVVMWRNNLCLALQDRLEKVEKEVQSLKGENLALKLVLEEKKTFASVVKDGEVEVDSWKDVASQFTVYCREREVCQLQKALKETPLVDWHGNLHIGCMPHYLLGPIKEVTHHLGLSLDSVQCHTFTYHPHLDTQPLRCRAGFCVRLLGKAGLQHLLETSQYAKDSPLETMWRFIQKVPSVGVYLDQTVAEDTSVELGDMSAARNEEVPVSGITSSTFGALGMLRTEEDYRGMGLACLVSRVTARLQASQGYLPHVMVNINNTTSRDLFTHKSGWRHSHFSFMMSTDFTNINYY
ncbi:putative FR47-like protein domain-containing protein 7 [Homarus americanus]|uniref:Putative FR47-like protein domain-containing protein 7 n=1 Tax=Homarus americanus TaxID=6706 RepID=A0A8J5N7A2_HOMAM|nr:putative FR47-like protein domain-containing protein 7 [Homarus americanus]